MDGLITDIVKYGALAIGVFGIFFEITPIKFSPISLLLTWIGSKTNKELLAKVDEQSKELSDFKEEMRLAMERNENKLTEHEKASDTYEINRMRYEILDFSNACQNHRKHTRREFEHIISLYPEYEKILEKWGLSNGQIDQEMAYIMELDLICKRENSYLPDNYQ